MNTALSAPLPTQPAKTAGEPESEAMAVPFKAQASTQNCVFSFTKVVKHFFIALEFKN
jgi:hypothetical protein